MTASAIVRFLRNQVGAAAVETAFILPIFLMVMLGFFEYGRWFWVQDTLQKAVMVGGRYASLNKTATNTQISTVVTQNLTGLKASEVNVTVAPVTIGGVTHANITATTPFGGVTNYIPQLKTMTVTAKAAAPRG